jgi:hypothetical protein
MDDLCLHLPLNYQVFDSVQLLAETKSVRSQSVSQQAVQVKPRLRLSGPRQETPRG